MLLKDDLPILEIVVINNGGMNRMINTICEEALLLISQTLLRDNMPRCDEEMILKDANANYRKVAASQVGHPVSEF